jgi:hypothetical protein
LYFASAAGGCLAWSLLPCGAELEQKSHPKVYRDEQQDCRGLEHLLHVVFASDGTAFLGNELQCHHLQCRVTVPLGVDRREDKAN